ncbi:FAD-dependent monooxygenase [Streptomyces coffeae]|uniref:FAD-dependent monooxygenase n=1 Tax=Streptomyces coffeae TaxID=621382 RepID=UPI0027DCEF4F|nr:FAD-dependent monooxygenase [Streptomyces coffeae]
MVDHVVVVGAGPTGLLLATELRLAGVPVTVVERAAERSPHSKALTLHPRTLEVFALRGIAERFTAEGAPLPVAHYAGLPTRLDLSVLDTRFPYTLILPQLRTEQLLEERLRELGGEVRWSHRVLAVRQYADGAGAEVEVAGPDGTGTLRAAWVVGCDGAGSTVRSSAGIDFPGTPTTLTGFLGDVLLDAPPPAEGAPSYDNAHGGIMVVPLAAGYHRIVGSTRGTSAAPSSQPFTLEELRTAVREVAGTDFGMHTPRWLSRFGNAARQAARYREGRVLLAGDAAHMHMPFGGQGLNVGVQDAFNLGWKLASVCHGRAPAALLDTYHDERHPVGAALLENTRAQTVIGTAHTADTPALRSVLSGILADHPDVNRRLAGQISALDVAYPDPGGALLVGERAPDVGLDGAPEPGLYPLLADGRFVLLHLMGTAAGADSIATAAALAGGEDRIRTVAARPTTVHRGWDGLATVLVRPDGHIAWAHHAVDGGADGPEWATRRRRPVAGNGDGGAAPLPGAA